MEVLRAEIVPEGRKESMSMLKKQDIRVGKSYVNEGTGTVREVVAELSRHMVKYNTFDLSTGNLAATPLQVCHAGRLARWADREARQEEIRRLHPYALRQRVDKPLASPVDKAKSELSMATIAEVAGKNAVHRW